MKPKPCIALIKRSPHLRTIKKCRKHSPPACVFYISPVFSNACHVLSHCNTWLGFFITYSVHAYFKKQDIFT